jgi:hypothetical protein
LKRVAQGLYRDPKCRCIRQVLLHVNFSINENIGSEREAFALEMEALQYHTRAMATDKEHTRIRKI